MGATGTATLDFGAFPGSAMASVSVIGQASISSLSLVEAWMSLDGATATHSSDEHLIENMKIHAGTIVVGTGFTIYGESNNPQANGNGGNRLYGTWTINWAWL
jgi:hypothetical protein